MENNLEGPIAGGRVSYLRAGGGGLARGDVLGRDDGAHGNGGNGHGGHGCWLLAFVKWRCNQDIFWLIDLA